MFVAALALFSCENSESELSALNQKSIQKDEAIKVESFISEAGKPKARLTTPLMLRLNADTPYVEFPQTLHVDFYNPEKVVESGLDSKYGKYFESLNKVYLKDSVIIISIKGDTMICEDVWWDQDLQKFYSSRKTILKSKEIPYYIAQDGFEATQDLKQKKFYNSSGKILAGEDSSSN